MGKVYATLTNLALVALLTTAASRAAAVETTSENFVVSATAIQGTSGTTPRMNFFGVSTVNCISYAGKANAAGPDLLLLERARFYRVVLGYVCGCRRSGRLSGDRFNGAIEERTGRNRVSGWRRQGGPHSRARLSRLQLAWDIEKPAEPEAL